MQPILVDACGWVALVDGGIHLERALDPLFGRWTLVVLPSVEAELTRLAEARSAPLLLELLATRRDRALEAAAEAAVDAAAAHTDARLAAAAAAERWPVLTVDRALKRRLQTAGSSWIEPTRDRRLRLVE